MFLFPTNQLLHRVAMVLCFGDLLLKALNRRFFMCHGSFIFTASKVLSARSFCWTSPAVFAGSIDKRRPRSLGPCLCFAWLLSALPSPPRAFAGVLRPLRCMRIGWLRRSAVLARGRGRALRDKLLRRAVFSVHRSREWGREIQSPHVGVRSQRQACPAEGLH